MIIRNLGWTSGACVRAGAQRLFGVIFAAFLIPCGCANELHEVVMTRSSPVRLVSLEISPDAISMPVGMTQELIAIARFSDGTVRDVTDLVAWASNSLSVAQVTTDGVVLTAGAGIAIITAHYESTASQASVSVTEPSLEARLHDPLPEQNIWSTDAAPRDQTRFFRAEFPIQKVPRAATLYIAGPQNIAAYLNGRLAANAEAPSQSRTKPFVSVVDVSSFLQAGRNLLALACSNADSVVAKIVPALPGVNDPPLLLSDSKWKVTLVADPGWMQTGYDASRWSAATSLGGVESTREFTQGALDFEMYKWAGYDGISPFLARNSIFAANVVEASAGAGQIGNLEALIQPSSSGQFFVVSPETAKTDSDYPHLILDFGREISGRLELESRSASSAKIRLRYGESIQEAISDPYYGENELAVPPGTTVYGPKSGFRYVELKFISGPPLLIFEKIKAEEIFYPVSYRASFDSSDPIVNRIWSTGARTAHLVMQDGVWDGIKRDRTRWMGDLYVSGRVIHSVFADRMLTPTTIDLLGRKGLGPTGFVNNIPGYTAFWIMGLADYYRYSGDAAFLIAHHDQLSTLLQNMQNSIDGSGLIAFDTRVFPFVDWSADFFTDTPESRTATQFEFYRAFSEGAWLLQELGDTTGAKDAWMTASLLRRGAKQFLLNTASNTFGDRWQTNAAAIFSGACDSDQTESIWLQVLSSPSPQPVTPYYNYFVIKAMAQAGHRSEALSWMRAYWGGMLAEGATSFWEAYDLSWPKDNFHEFLQADRTEGYYVSLAHGWSSGPTAWLMEEVLGIQPLAPGFKQVSIRPDLAGLRWVRGHEATPYGNIAVSYSAESLLSGEITLPDYVQVFLSLPVSAGQSFVFINGVPTRGLPSESATRLVVVLDRAGKYEFQTH